MNMSSLGLRTSRESVNPQPTAVVFKLYLRRLARRITHTRNESGFCHFKDVGRCVHLALSLEASLSNRQ